MLGKFIKAKLQEKGWSMHHFAQRCGVAISSVSRIVNGKQANLTDKMKQRLASGLGISLRELEIACRDDSLHYMLNEMERISDNLSTVMTLRERHQILSIIHKARTRAEQDEPLSTSEKDKEI